MRRLCSSMWDVIKHGDRSPSPMGVNWVSDRVGIDSKEIYICVSKVFAFDVV